MRKVLLALILVVMALPFHGFADENYTEIELSGLWDEHKTRGFGTETLIIPIEGRCYENGMVMFQFACNVSNLTISIMRDDRAILQRTIGVTNGQIESFALQSYPSGNYKVIITTPSGSYVYGFFEL